MPPSPPRMEFDTAFLLRTDGLAVLATPDFEAWLRLATIEGRPRAFNILADVAEFPADPPLARTPAPQNRSSHAGMAYRRFHGARPHQLG